MKNKIYKIPCIIVCLLFCCPFFVYADTTLNISNSLISSFDKDRVDNLIDFAEDLLSEDTYYKFYFIEPSSTYYKLSVCRNPRNNPYVIYQSDLSRLRFSVDISSCNVYRNPNDSSDINYYNNISQTTYGFNMGISNNELYLSLLAYGGSIPLTYASEDTLIFTSANGDFSPYTLNTNDDFPSLYSLLYPPYTPPVDTTPLLTEFFTLCIDKISFITDYFISNYIFLSIFVIFIIFSFIYFIKRRLI